MTAPAAQWQLDRLSADAREAAETAALEVGVSLSSWLTKSIDEACAAEGVTPPAAPPKILEFTRGIRDRIPATPRLQAAPPVATAPAPEPMPAGATLLPVTAMVAANLGTRRGDDVPDALPGDIAAHGLHRPVTVRRSASNPEQYEIICGHRRWRAAQRIDLAQIPAIVVTQDDDAAILASLAENLALDNLSAIDEAQAYLRLLTQFAVDVSAVTAAIGRDRQHIVQSMRLLGLPPLVRHLITAGMLSREHADVLLDASQPEALADAILADHLSVEAARQRITAGAEGKP
jgi:ParB family chromosome partitioning protein